MDQRQWFLKPGRFWKVMIVDDEKSIHDITTTSLRGFMFEGRGIRFLKEYARIIQSSAASLLAITNDILDISKIESGRIIFEHRRFSVKMLLHEVISLFRFKAGEKKLDLIIDVSEDIPHFLVGDETRIKQILINLVGNAVKFTEQGFVRLAARIEEKDDCLLFLRWRIQVRELMTLIRIGCLIHFPSRMLPLTENMAAPGSGLPYPGILPGSWPEM
jgi:signal transduction histidine kinase